MRKLIPDFWSSTALTQYIIKLYCCATRNFFSDKSYYSSGLTLATIEIVTQPLAPYEIDFLHLADGPVGFELET